MHVPMIHGKSAKSAEADEMMSVNRPVSATRMPAEPFLAQDMEPAA
jgi:hypothetical protein